MKSTAAKKEEFTFPSGGIADFYMEDHEIETLEKEEAEQEFGSAGIATFNPIARRMASYGRYGDDTVAHVETGELVVPKALIDSNPKLKDSIFNHLRELGVEDPEQYIVGSGVNSINPDTGMPEFFFKKIFKGIKKAVSSIARGVKKAFKGVGKVLKKVAPIVLPVALAMTPLGPIYGAALGSGIGTLASGGDLKDAVKNALIAGGTGALFSGFTGKGATFTERVGNALADPAGRLSQAASGVKGTFTGKGLTGEGTLFSDFTPTQAVSTEVTPTTPISDATTDVAKQKFLEVTPENYPGGRNFGQQVKEPGIFDTAGDLLFRGGQSKADVIASQGLKRTAAINEYLKPFGKTIQTINEAAPSVQKAALAAGDAAAKAAGPGLFTKVGPSLALAGLGAAAGGFFTKPEEPELNIEDIQGVTGSDLLRDNPDKYLLAGRGSGTPGQVVVPTDYQFIGQMPDFRSIYPQTFAADGGEIFPRRTGGIMPNEGTPGKDSVRAMLMPGEFVMTTDAVKGMGDGNNEKGINRMYDMMRNLESRGRAMA